MALTASEASFFKTLTWGTRLFQLCLSIILLGALSYIIDEHREFAQGRYARFIPHEVIVPEVFSIFAIPITLFGLFAIFFFPFRAQIVAAGLDLILFVGWVASAGLLHHNFRTDGRPNRLAKYLNAIRRSHGARGHQSLNGHLVRLIAALIVIQIILFLVTGLLAILVAVHEKRKKAAEVAAAAAAAAYVPEGKIGGVEQDEKVKEYWKGRDSSDTAV